MKYLLSDNPDFQGIQIGDSIIIPMSIYSNHIEYISLQEKIIAVEKSLNCKYVKNVEHPDGVEPYIILTFE